MNTAYNFNHKTSILLNAKILLLNIAEITARNGDIDFDGRVNSMDLTILRNQLLNETKNQNIELFDINIDRAINALDIVRLKKMIANSLLF